MGLYFNLSMTGSLGLQWSANLYCLFIVLYDVKYSLWTVCNVCWVFLAVPTLHSRIYLSSLLKRGIRIFFPLLFYHSPSKFWGEEIWNNVVHEKTSLNFSRIMFANHKCWFWSPSILNSFYLQLFMFSPVLYSVWLKPFCSSSSVVAVCILGCDTALCLWLLGFLGSPAASSIQLYGTWN